MNKNNIRYAGYVLCIIGLIGIISHTGRPWSGYVVVTLGIIILLLTTIKKPG